MDTRAYVFAVLDVDENNRVFHSSETLKLDDADMEMALDKFDKMLNEIEKCLEDHE